MNKKRKGFSLAELLISLLVISIVLSAAIPTLTRRSGAERESIWRWASENNSAYFGVGSNQSAIIGYNTTPLSGTLLETVMNDSTIKDTESEYLNSGESDTGVINVGDLLYSNTGDKLIILKKNVQGNNSNLLNSHISFYTMSNDETATTADIKYAGRLSMDQGNIALGMGALQSIDVNNIGENTALGHFALMRTSEGFRNTAVGKKALSYNDDGDYNTALGFAALFELNGTHFGNTAIGAQAMEHKTSGDNNVAVGFQALKYNLTGDYNNAIGYNSLRNLAEGDENIAIGEYSCSTLLKGSNNICIGTQAGNNDSSTEDNYGLYIGSGGTVGDGVPLITGHTYKTDDDDKELIVNARRVEFRPYDGGNALFVFNSMVGTSDGYDETSSSVGRTGTALFNLRDTGGSGDKTSVTMAFTGVKGAGTNEKTANIYTYDQYNQSDTERLADIKFNDLLTFDFPPETGSTTYTGTIGIITNDDYTLKINDKLEIKNNDDTPNMYLNDYGFDLKINDSNSQEIKIADGEYFISLYDGTNNFYVGSDTLSAKASTINITGSDSGNSISLNSGNVVIGDEDIYLKRINDNNNGYVGASIKELYYKVNQLQQQTGTPSDARLKNISGDNTAGLKEINALEVKNYTYKEDKEKTPHVGVIAQQLKEIFPNSVFKGDDGYLRIKTEEIFYAMVNSIKELFTKIQDLTAKITGLDKRITELEQQNKLLIEQNKAFEKRLDKLEKKAAK